MPSDGPQLLAGYKRLDALEVARGKPATSPAWMELLERFLLGGKRRCVVRKGRQVGASTIIIPRLAVAIALFGSHAHRIGTRLSIVLVSVAMREVRERLFNIASVLDDIGEPYVRRDDTIEMQNYPIVFAPYPCSARFSVGMTSIAIFEDEVARWWSDDANANPAHEVDGTLLPSTITQLNARVFTASSPRGPDNFLEELMARGETPEQCVASGPTWFWNPTVSEADTRALQPDLRLWQMDFAAQPRSGPISALDADRIRAAVRGLHPNTRALGRPIGTTDAAEGANDSWATLFAQVVAEPCRELPYLEEERTNYDSHGRPSVYRYPRYDSAGHQIRNPLFKPEPTIRFVVFDCFAFEGAFRATLDYDSVVATIADRANRASVRDMWGDENLGFANEAAFSRHSINFKSLRTSPESLAQSAVMLRTLLRDGRLILLPGPESDRTAKELLALQEVILPSGRLTLRSRRTSEGHGDRASCVLLLARLIAGADGVVPGSPLTRRRDVLEFDPFDPAAAA